MNSPPNNAVPSTIGEGGRRIWVYPERRDGPRAVSRRRIGYFLILIYLLTPWVQIAGRPLVRLEASTGIAYLFGFVLRMNDAPTLVFLLLLLGLTLFLVTALRGRWWCGYACPQTVFLDWVLRPIEEWIEGDANTRMRRDKGPATFSLFLRKFSKQLLFLAVSAVVANIFLAFFVAPKELLAWVTHSPSEHPVGFGLMAGILALFYIDLAWFREQFCAFLCPYARFQSILLDSFSPTVGYDKSRGEPRGHLGTTKGDCIDCGLCVRVCPTGIDIRDGLQLECIACERCVDACDEIMEGVNKPKGLVRVATQTELEGKKEPHRTFRPRVVLYSVALAIAFSGFAYVVHVKQGIKITLLRAPGAPFSQMTGGKVANLFNLRVSNNGNQPIPLHLEIQSPKGAELICGACADTLQPLEEKRFVLSILFDPRAADASQVVIRETSSGEVFQAPLLRP